MGFWELLKNQNIEKKSGSNAVLEKISNALPDASDNEKITIACLAGLMARVAYVDFNYSDDELHSMQQIITTLTGLHDIQAKTVISIASKQIKELAGLDHHIYAHTLAGLMSEKQRYGVLEALFYIAGSDNCVMENESEEIRLITKGLNLTPKHFLAARATVWEKLKALDYK